MLRVPELYFRVLDVMRGMNLPAPFADDERIVERPHNFNNNLQSVITDKKQANGDDHDCESESDDDTTAITMTNGNEIPAESGFATKELDGLQRNRLK